MANRLALAITLLVTVHASADKYARQQTVKIDDKISDRARPLHAKPSSSTQPLRADDVLASELAPAPLRNEQEHILLELIAATPDRDVDEKADLYFRLAELNARRYMLARLQARGAANDQARRFLLDAVKAYQALTENDAFRNFARMDMALFYYAYTLKLGKYMKEARTVYDKLLKNYPSSKYVADAHLAFAEYYFEQNQLADAEARYKLVLKFPRTSVYWYALYKLGWVYLNRTRYQDALETFYQLAEGTQRDPKQAILHGTATKDFVRAYAEVGKADKAFDAFKRLDQKAALELLARLGEIYTEQGKSDKGIFTFRELMRLAPQHRDVCQWQYNVAQLTLSLAGASTADKVAEIENLARLWTALAAKRSVTRGRTIPAGEADDCRDNAAAMAGDYARAYHSEAVKTLNPDTFGYAERLYKIYVATFPAAPDLAKTRYYYAELLWTRASVEPKPRLQAELWERAAGAFTAAIKTGKLDARLTRESAYAGVLAWMKALAIESPADPKPDAGLAAKPIPSREQGVIDAVDIYIKYVTDPIVDELVGIKFQKARIYYRYNHFAEAMPIFQEIVSKYPTHETAEFAINLMLDSYNRHDDERGLIALTDRVLAAPALLAGKDDLAARVDKLRRTFERKQAERLRNTKDFASLVQCGQAFLAIYNRDPTAKDNDEVLYNAGVCFEEGRSLDAAIRMYNLLEKYYPSSKLTAHAIARSGKVYGDLAFYAQAAERLEQYAKKYAGEQDAYNAINDAVLYWRGTGNDSKAIDNTKYFVKTFGAKRPAEAANAAFSLTSIYEKQGDSDAVVRHLREYVRVHGAKGGADKLVIAHAKIGRILFDQSCPIAASDGACVRITRARAIAKQQTRRSASELPTQCGTESKIKLTVVRRDEHKLREALQEFAASERELAKVHGEAGEARHYVAIGKLAEADVELERYFDVKFPANLDFDPKRPAIKQHSTARFDAWIDAKKKLGAAARAKYEDVLAVKDAAASIAAAARLGQLAQHFSDALFTAEIPRDVRSGQFAEDKVEAYCDTMTKVAEPLEAKALEGFGVCLRKSTELGWFSEWSKLCERELGQIRPEEYPTASELRGDATFVAQLITVEPPPTL